MEETQEKVLELENVSKDNSVTEKVSSPGKNARRWVLTLNNPDKTDEDMVKYIESLEHIKYSIFQRERGHLKETEHFQMFLIFTIGKRFSTIKTLFPEAHIEACKGSNVQCRDYCSKQDTRVSGPYEIGEFQEERGRTDIKTIEELLKADADDKTIRELMPNAYQRYYNYIQTLRQNLLREEHSNKIKENFICIYIYGKSGIGKTSSFFNEYGNKAYFVKNYNKDPWFSYKNQDLVVFDEFRSQFDFSDMLNYIDLYPVELSRRYNDMYGNYTKAVIMCNDPPRMQYEWWYKNRYESWEGFLRRIHFVLEFQKDKIYVEKASKDIEELKKVLPKNMIELLDYSKLTFNKHTTDKSAIQTFEQVPIDELPFNDDLY